MDILVVGAGALGGYFGGRLLAAGRNVTFLVRPNRAKQLAATGGLAISSPAGDLLIKEPPLAEAGRMARRYDLVLLGCKAYSLEGCMADFAPAVGPDTAILPVLNGMRHIDMLAERFGRERVLGGFSMISATLADDGRVLHQSPYATLDYGELDGTVGDRLRRVDAALANAGFTAKIYADITLGMWEKWLAIASIAGMTCLMRCAIGDYVKAGAAPVALALLEECASIARRNGFAPRDDFLAKTRKTLTNPESANSASMFKDMERGNPVEADHIIGDLLRRAPEGAGDSYPLLRLVDLHLKSYAARRERAAR